MLEKKTIQMSLRTKLLFILVLFNLVSCNPSKYIVNQKDLLFKIENKSIYRGDSTILSWDIPLQSVESQISINNFNKLNNKGSLTIVGDTTIAYTLVVKNKKKYFFTPKQKQIKHQNNS